MLRPCLRIFSSLMTCFFLLTWQWKLNSRHVWICPAGPYWHVEVINIDPICAFKHQWWREPKVLAVRKTCMLCVWLFSSNLGLYIYGLNLFFWLSMAYRLIVYGAELNQQTLRQNTSELQDKRAQLQTRCVFHLSVCLEGEESRRWWGGGKDGGKRRVDLPSYCSGGGWRTPRKELNGSYVHIELNTAVGKWGMNTAERIGHS